MKKFLGIVFLISPFFTYGGHTCKQVSEFVKSCEIEYGRYLVKVTDCKTAPYSSQPRYSFGYFSVGEVVLKKKWLETDHHIVHHSFTRVIEQDFRNIQTPYVYPHTSLAERVCESLRSPYAAQTDSYSELDLKKIIQDFIENWTSESPSP